MSFRPRYTILIDGAFVIRKLESRLKRFPTAQDIQSIAKVIAESECVSDLARLRVYFYHARPTADVLVNPISKEQITLGTTQVFAHHSQLLDELETLPDFALRLGETDTTGWRVGDTAFRHIMRKPRLLRASDLVPVITQKGVDLRIGLDMARLALTRSVEAIVAVTGDSDLIPAFKFVRREGVRVFLCHMGHRIKRDLAAHADRTVKFDPPSPEAIYRHVDEAA
jgi:uncharacterized LabA/DUF88 family protein